MLLRVQRRGRSTPHHRRRRRRRRLRRRCPQFCSVAGNLARDNNATEIITVADAASQLLTYYTAITDRVGREDKIAIIASVRPSVCPSVCFPLEPTDLCT